MDGVFLRSVLVMRPFPNTPIDGAGASGLVLLEVAGPGGVLDAAIASSLAFDCELVDRGKLEGRLAPFST